jgi:hypothetical protein
MLIRGEIPVLNFIPGSSCFHLARSLFPEANGHDDLYSVRKGGRHVEHWSLVFAVRVFAKPLVSGWAQASFQIFSGIARFQVTPLFIS